MRAIAVLAYKNTEYLYITLEGIFSAHGIEDWPVYVYFDRAPDAEIDMDLRRRQMDAIRDFPVAGASFPPKGTGIFDNFMRSFRETFSLGYDEVLFIEEDNLIAVDALTYLDDLPRNSFFYSLFRFVPSGEQVQQVGTFSPHGFLITRDSFSLIDSWIRAGAYWGFEWPGTPDLYTYAIANLHLINYDGIVDGLGKKYDLPMVIPGRSRVAHFGLQGVNQRADHAEELNLAHAELVAGERKEWLPRLAAKLKSGDYSDVVAERLFPRGFIHNPEVDVGKDAVE